MSSSGQDERRDDDYNKYERNRRNSENRNSSRRYSDKEVNHIHYADYDDSVENDDVDGFIKEQQDQAQNELHKEVIGVIYKEGNSNIDPTKLTIDTGCTKTVAGRPWLDAYKLQKPSHLKLIVNMKSLSLVLPIYLCQK